MNIQLNTRIVFVRQGRFAGFLSLQIIGFKSLFLHSIGIEFLLDFRVSTEI